MDTAATKDPGESAGTLRRLVLLLVLLGSVGLALELFFLEHTESVWQWIPLVALGFGFATGVAIALRPSAAAIRVFRTIMGLFVAAGLLGLYLHYRGNVEFEMEQDPAVRGLTLVWRSLKGATPALAPGALAQLGLLGLLYAYRHPALRGAGRQSLTEER